MLAGTDQFVILGRQLGEPLVELQDSYYSYQIPDDTKRSQQWIFLEIPFSIDILAFAY